MRPQTKVRKFRLHRGRQHRLTARTPSQEEIAAALSEDLLDLADGDPARVDRIIAILNREETWTGVTA